jgi:hypothetical protein
MGKSSNSGKILNYGHFCAKKARENLSTPCPAGGGAGSTFNGIKERIRKNPNCPLSWEKNFTVHKKIRAFRKTHEI